MNTFVFCSSQAERLLAASSQPVRFKAHTIFSGGAGDTTVSAPTPFVSQPLYDMNSMMLSGMQMPGMMQAANPQFAQYGAPQVPLFPLTVTFQPNNN